MDVVKSHRSIKNIQLTVTDTIIRFPLLLYLLIYHKMTKKQYNILHNTPTKHIQYIEQEVYFIERLKLHTHYSYYMKFIEHITTRRIIIIFCKKKIKY